MPMKTSLREAEKHARNGRNSLGESCMHKAETKAMSSDEWLMIARVWSREFGNALEASKCVEKAISLATGTTTLIKCAGALEALLIKSGEVDIPKESAGAAIAKCESRLNAHLDQDLYGDSDSGEDWYGPYPDILWQDWVEYAELAFLWTTLGGNTPRAKECLGRASQVSSENYDGDIWIGRCLVYLVCDVLTAFRNSRVGIPGEDYHTAGVADCLSIAEELIRQENDVELLLSAVDDVLESCPAGDGQPLLVKCLSRTEQLGYGKEDLEEARTLALLWVRTCGEAGRKAAQRCMRIADKLIPASLTDKTMFLRHAQIWLEIGGEKSKAGARRCMRVADKSVVGRAQCEWFFLRAETWLKIGGADDRESARECLRQAEHCAANMHESSGFLACQEAWKRLFGLEASEDIARCEAKYEKHLRRNLLLEALREHDAISALRYMRQATENFSKLQNVSHDELESRVAKYVRLAEKLAPSGHAAQCLKDAEQILTIYDGNTPEQWRAVGQAWKHLLGTKAQKAVLRCERLANRQRISRNLNGLS